MKYIVSVDDSEYSMRAFELALKLVKPQDELFIIHCLELAKPSVLISEAQLLIILLSLLSCFSS
jgi:hypothetical protein